MAGKKKAAIEIRDMMDSDGLAVHIVEQFTLWNQARRKWLEERRELRNYLFAIDTRTTSANHLPWKNTVHLPKLCQIRDNLHANYIAAIFPNDRSVRWEGDDRSAETKQKRQVIESYMRNKMRQSSFKTDMSQAILDFIDYGNCFGLVDFEFEQRQDPFTGETIYGYVGPKFYRISPHDIVFDPMAASFAATPKIIRTLSSLADLKAYIEDHPEAEALSQVFDKAMMNRRQFQGISEADVAISEAYAMDGFGSWHEYLDSDYVEIMTFYGDLYDRENDKIYKNYKITVIDRSLILEETPNPSWLASAPIFHCSWRQRPDNLYGMGPLDNLVGMQHRIDHLENAKADAFDLIIHPVMKIRGLVEDFEYGPNERIYVGDEGEVEFMRPDATMLNADTQIAIYEQKMEEMAGAPRQAMGFRTPGEKTAYEVQVLENGANKVFLNKSAYFEESFMEPVLNAMLESGRRNMTQSELIRTVDNDINAVMFQRITKEDITARGKIRPIGARHFARNANMVQNLTQMLSSPVGQDPGIRNHLSGKRIAELMQDLLGADEYELFSPNVQIFENAELQQTLQSAQQVVGEEGIVNADVAQGPARTQGPPRGEPETT